MDTAPDHASRDVTGAEETEPRTAPGLPLEEVTDPFSLGVRPAIGASAPDLPDLPVYVPREHDVRLGEVVARAAEGTSQVAVLVGGPSTGKTRACWQALDLLRERAEPWRLWQPADLTRPGDIAPYTVVWLDEAQLYLTPDKLGEKVAAGLRNLLSEPGQGPVLVMATLRPAHWDALTGRDEPDVHVQARELLDAHAITVPEAFSGTDLNALAAQAVDDPRLGRAAEHADEKQITQYLAGMGVLRERYARAPRATRALIWAAMDARRLGCGPDLPLRLLADAAPGYLTESQRTQTGDDWLRQALDYAAAPCDGITGILTPVTTTDPHAAGPLYRLADHLDQHGRRHRTGQIPPAAFWDAAAAHAQPADLTSLGNATRDRGLYRVAAQLHKIATTYGDAEAAAALVLNLHALHPADQRPAQHAAAHAALDDPFAVAKLLDSLREAGARGQAAELAGRAAAHAAPRDPYAVAVLLDSLRKAGADDQIDVLLAACAPATHVALDDPLAVAWLIKSLLRAGADDHIRPLAQRVATHVALHEPHHVSALLYGLRMAGADGPAAELARRAATHADLDDPYDVQVMLDTLREAEADGPVAVLAERAATHADLDKPDQVAWLLSTLRQTGADGPAAELAGRAATHTALNDLRAVATLLDTLCKAGADGPAAELAQRAATHANLDNPYGVQVLLGSLQQARADGAAAVLAERAATHVALDDPSAVATLLDALQKAEADRQAAALAERAAAHVALDDPRAVATMLDALQRAGADRQAAALAERAAAHTALDKPDQVARLLNTLCQTGADGPAALLAGRTRRHPHRPRQSEERGETAGLPVQGRSRRPGRSRTRRHPHRPRQSEERGETAGLPVQGRSRRPGRTPGRTRRHRRRP
ncbi:hypothetical protein [Actinomadura rugatobispora]|uniref:ATP-binding protein n=1 Tax=Actinomadura rugatobispora TaxID=1994 RepID=A0ABW1AEF0_9ACTN